MSVLHAVVARDRTILAESSLSTHTSSYTSLVTSILAKIPPNNSRLTYLVQDNLISYDKREDLVVLVITDQAFERRLVFTLLDLLHKRVRRPDPAHRAILSGLT